MSDALVNQSVQLRGNALVRLVHVEAAASCPAKVDGRRPQLIERKDLIGSHPFVSKIWRLAVLWPPHAYSRPVHVQVDPPILSLQ